MATGGKKEKRDLPRGNELQETRKKNAGGEKTNIRGRERVNSHLLISLRLKWGCEVLLGGKQGRQNQEEKKKIQHHPRS